MTPHPFRLAVEARDLDAMMACMSDDVTLHSPVTFRPFEGKDAARHVLGAVMRVFSDFRYTDELDGPDGHVLVFRARVGDREVEGIDLLRADAEGVVDDLTVLVRPLSGLQALAAAMAQELGAAPPPA